MKKIITPLILCIVLLAVLTACATAGSTKHSSSYVLDRILERDELIVGTTASMPPFNMKNASGEIIGYEIDLAQYFSNSLGVKLRFETMPFVDLLPALEEGRVDMVMSGMTMTADRNARVAFVGPYFVSGKSFLTKLQTVATVDNPSEVNNGDWTFTALEGSTSQVFVEQLLSRANFVAVKTYDDAIQMIRRNEADALVADYPVCALNALLYQDEGFIFLPTPLTYEPVGVALPADDPLFINWVENRLMTIEGSGIMEELLTYWFGGGSWINDLP
jgi:polar amino acid transport system substrate-binding protein